MAGDIFDKYGIGTQADTKQTVTNHIMLSKPQATSGRAINTQPVANSGIDVFQKYGIGGEEKQYPEQSGGFLKNLAAGAAEFPGALASILAQAPANINDDTGLSPRPGPEQGAQVAHMVNQGLGHLGFNPEDVQANTLGDRIARSTGLGAVSMLLPGVGEEVGATSMLGRAGNMAKNVAVGGVAGASGEAGSELLPNYVPDKFKPAAKVVGGLLGGLVAPGAVSMLTHARSYVRPFMKSGQENIAGNLLNEAAGGGPVNFESAPLPGMKPTTGQSTNNPGLIWLEPTMQQKSGPGAIDMQGAKTANNTAMVDAINGLGDAKSDSAADMEERINSAQAKRDAATQEKWKAAGIDKDTNIETAPLYTSVEGYISGLSAAEKKKLGVDFKETKDGTLMEGDLVSVLNKFPKNTNLKEVQGWRSEVRDALAKEKGKWGRLIIGGMLDSIDTFLENPYEAGGAGLAPEKKAAYDAARAATREQRGLESPPAMRGALENDRYGEPKVPTSAMADNFMKPRTQKGAPESFQSYLDYTGKAGHQAARDAFTKKFLDAAQSYVPDQNGQGLVGAGSVRKFIDDYSHIIDSDIFNEDQRKLIQSIADASDMQARVARGVATGGPDTYAKLSGDRYLEALIHPGAGELLPAVGAVVGSGLGWTGAFSGAIIGRKAADFLYKGLYSAPRDKVMDILRKAIADPDLAKSLMMKAGSYKMMSRTTQQKWQQLLKDGAVGATVPQFNEDSQ